MSRAKAVGIRQLKAHLSRELQRVKAGATVAVTERGRVIATIQPAGEAASAERGWASAMVASGKASWSGGKPSGVRALRPRGFLAAKHAFEADWPHLVAIDPTADLCHEAGVLAERHALRGFDALHLAAFAEVLRGLEGRADVRFSCFNGPLNRAAATLARSIR